MYMNIWTYSYYENHLVQMIKVSSSDGFLWYYIFYKGYMGRGIMIGCCFKYSDSKNMILLICLFSGYINIGDFIITQILDIGSLLYMNNDKVIPRIYQVIRYALNNLFKIMEYFKLRTSNYKYVVLFDSFHTIYMASHIISNFVIIINVSSLNVYMN